MQKCGNARLHFGCRFQPITAFEDMCGAFLFTGCRAGMSGESEGRGTFGPLPPECFDLLIHFFELGNDGSPVAEESCYLCWASALSRKLQNLTHARRNHVGD